MSRRGGGRFSLFADDVDEFGAVPAPAEARSRAAAAAARASVDLDQLRDQLRHDADARTDIATDFVSGSRLRFQQLLNGVSGPDAGGLRLSPDNRFQQLMGSTCSDSTGEAAPRALSTGDSGSGGIDLLDSSAAGLLDSPAAGLLTDRPSLLADQPGFSERMRESRLASRLDGGLAPRQFGGAGMSSSSAMVNSSSSSIMKSSSSAVVNSSSSSSRSAASSVLALRGDRSVAGEAEPAVAVMDDGDDGGGGALSRPQVTGSRQQTFQQSRTASNTTFSQSMDGGPAQTNTTRLSQRQQTCATSENGETSVAQQRAQQLHSATLTSHNGETRLDAQQAQLAQQVEAVSHGDGTTEVSEKLRTSGATRQATFEETDSGEMRQRSAAGQDFSARAQLDYVHESGRDGATGQFKINSGVAGDGDEGRRPLPWRFSAFGPLIQPPSGRIRGQVVMQTSHSMFNCQAGALPRFSGAQFSFQDTFEISESESDDEDLCLPPPRRRGPLALPASSPGATSPPPPPPASEAPSEPLSERYDDVSDDVARAEEEERRRQERLARIANELLITERKYVDELHLIDQIFHFRVDQENRAHHMFNNEITTQMFSNIKSIYQFHKDHMLPQLEARLAGWDDDPRIGDIMKTCAPFLKMYTEFVKNFDNAMNLINAFSAKCSRFAAIMNEIHEMEECSNLPLQHHMIVPIQRVPRYELLLKDYLKRLTEDSPDYEDTRKALELVTHAATHSNDAMKRVDKFKQLLEVQENISGGPDLVSPTRELVRHGKIFKISARSGDHQERYLFLFSDMLLLCSPRLINSRIISGPAYRLRARFSVEGMQVLEGDNLETVNTFYINGNQKNVELYTQTADEKADWLEALCQVVTSFYERRASLRSEPAGMHELGRRPPVMLRQDGVSRCMECEAQFGMMRRRHGCHACGIVVCGKCSSHKVALPWQPGKQARACGRCSQLLAARADQPSDTSAAQRRHSVLDVSYTRGKGVLDVAAAGDSLLSGWLQLRGRKSGSRRWFCLRADFVLYSYETDDSARALTATPVPGFTVAWGGSGGRAESAVAEKDRDRSLRLAHARKSYLFLAESKEDVARWAAALQGAARAEVAPHAASAV